MTSLPLRRALPSQQRVSARGVSDFIEAVNAADLELHSFMLYRDGAVVAEAFWAPYCAERLHVQHSATKSWVSMAVGLLVDDGVLSLDAKVVQLVQLMMARLERDKKEKAKQTASAVTGAESAPSAASE